MAARKYEISPRVSGTREEKSRISKRPCNVHTTEIAKHFFVVKNAIYYVAIATVIFSRVKVTCFFTCGDIMLSRESSPGISLVFI